MGEPKKNNAVEPNNKLSILISQDGLSFYASDPLTAKTITFEEKAFDIILTPEAILAQVELIFEKHDWDHIGKTHILYANNLYGLVPQALFDEDHLGDYLKFGSKILSTDFIAYDEIPAAELNNVHIPYTNINNYFFDKVGSFQYEHVTSVLIKNILSLEEHQNETVYLNVFNHHFDMVVMKNNKLILCNSFHYSAPEDFAYYVLFVAEQLKLDPEKFRLIFLGNISESSEIYKMCYTYIRNCTFLAEEQNLWTQLGLSNFSSKPNYVLLKAHLCA